MTDKINHTSAKDKLVKRFVAPETIEGAEEVSQLTSVDTEAVPVFWGEPIPIKSGLLPVMKFESTLLPSPLREYAEDIANRKQCPIDFIAAGLLSAIGSVIGSGCAIRPKQKDSWTEIPNLWGGIVARPGLLKSPAIADTFSAVGRLESKASEEHKAQKKRHSAELVAFKAEQEALASQMKTKASKKTSEEQSTSMEDLKEKYATLDEPPAPVARRFIVQDATIQKIGEILQDNPRGLLVKRDELIGLFRGFDKPGKEQDRAFYLEAWNGYGEFTIDTIGRGTNRIPNMCLTVFGGIQPDRLLNYLYQATMAKDNDGLVQRLQILVYPDESTDWKLVDKYPNSKAKADVATLIEILATVDFTNLGATRDSEGDRPYFRFASDAQLVFNEWLTDLELNKLRGAEEEIVVEHLSKYRGLMPSIALIFHSVELAMGGTPGPVTKKAAVRAADVCDYLESHARRVYGLLVGVTRKAAAKLSEKISKGEIKDGFSLRDIYNNGWSLLSDKNVVTEACQILVEANWLISQQKRRPEGGRPTVVYRINPMVGKHNG